MASNEEEEDIPLPRFDHDEYEDRGYYLVSEFRDEKRRRDRAAAVKTARNHPSYVCLMTPDNRLLHRNVYRGDDLVNFLFLQDLISTWSSPRFYVMGYPIDVDDLLRGIECFAEMGETCNPLTGQGDDAHSSTFGCPRASISLKYMHPKAWYATFYEPDPDDPKRYVRLDLREGEPTVEELDDHLDAVEAEEEEDPNQRSDLAKMRRISRRYCGCPLIQLNRAQAIYDGLPEEIHVDDDEWRIAPDIMGEPSLQPKSKKVHLELIERYGLADLPNSDEPESRPPEEPEEPDEPEEKLSPAEKRRRKLQKYTWLE